MARQLLLLLTVLFSSATAVSTSQHSRQIVSLLSTYLWNEPLPTSQAQEELELFGFSSDGICYQATTLVLNSIPFSCHSALSQLMRASSSPPLDIEELALSSLDSELCQTYCSYPLRQAGEDCHQLLLFHEALNGACLSNVNGTM